MKKTWVPCVVGVLLGVVPFISGCAERREQPASQSAVERESPSIAGKAGSEGGSPSAPSAEGEMEQQPGGKEKQERG